MSLRLFVYVSDFHWDLSVEGGISRLQCISFDVCPVTEATREVGINKQGPTLHNLYDNLAFIGPNYDI